MGSAPIRRPRGRGGACGTRLCFGRIRARLPRMPKPMSLQDCFAEIEAAVHELEDGDLPLEAAFTCYEAGLKRLREARAQLDRYQARFEELRGEDDGGDT